VGALGLLRQLAARRLLRCEVAANGGEPARRRRHLDLGGAQCARALVALRRFARDPSLERLDLLANDGESGLAFAPVLRQPQRRT
jgi:hypothetical protein